MDLAGRLKALIDRDFDSNLNRAANTWHVPQPTLYRYVRGLTSAPRARTLRTIAKFYGTTVEWLLDGTDSGPIDVPYSIVEYRGWEALVKSLRLPAEVGVMVRGLPANVGNAHFVLCDWAMMFGKYKSVSMKRMEPALRAKWLAGALQLESWTVWLRGLVTAYGPKAVRNKLLSELDRLRLGFQPFASYLLNDGKLPSDLATLYREFCPPEREALAPPSALMWSDSLPSVPPLNAVRGRQPRELPNPMEEATDGSA
jgi:hypothetical protein